MVKTMRGCFEGQSQGWTVATYQKEGQSYSNCFRKRLHVKSPVTQDLFGREMTCLGRRYPSSPERLSDVVYNRLSEMISHLQKSPENTGLLQRAQHLRCIDTQLCALPKIVQRDKEVAGENPF